MAKGVIYILTNPSFPNLVKIGYANEVEERVKQLNRSEGLPYAFRVFAIYEVDKRLTDRTLHKLIDNLNPNLRVTDEFNGKLRCREFYEMTEEEAYDLLKSISIISGTEDRLKRMDPSGREELTEVVPIVAKKRRPSFNFSNCKIPFGSEIVFVDDETIRPTVLDDRHIEYDGEKTSVSALAQELKGFGHPVQGTLWFTYNGELLSDLRDRLEKEGNK